LPRLVALIVWRRVQPKKIGKDRPFGSYNLKKWQKGRSDLRLLSTNAKTRGERSVQAEKIQRCDEANGTTKKNLKTQDKHAVQQQGIQKRRMAEECAVEIIATFGECSE